MALVWPQWIHEQWTNPVYYNFWSSEWGSLLIKVVEVAAILLVGRWLWPKVWHHFECDVEAPTNCHRRGHPVHGTGHKACGEHHQFRHDKRVSPTTAEDIAEHHKQAGHVARGIRPHPSDTIETSAGLITRASNEGS